jgi:hypothetical protein
VQQFHHVNIGGFFQLVWKSEKCNISPIPGTPRATTGHQKEQHIQRIENKKYKVGRCKTDSGWPERRKINWRADREHWRGASVNTSQQTAKK